MATDHIFQWGGGGGLSVAPDHVFQVEDNFPEVLPDQLIPVNTWILEVVVLPAKTLHLVSFSQTPTYLGPQNSWLCVPSPAHNK